MNKDKILSRLISGEIKLHNIENLTTPEDAVVIRREFISDLMNVNLDSINTFTYSPKTIINRNCENVIGSVGIPLGVAGPIRVLGIEKGDFILPIATTEGALIASINRGSKAVNAAGGARSIQNYSGITRAPVFTTKGLDDSYKFISFIKHNLEKFKDLTKQTSKHAHLIGFKPFVNGRTVWIRFAFDTSDAMGMNMAVVATKKITDYIALNYDIDLIAISGNVCIDKKTGLINEIEGRGHEVQAEITLSRGICNDILHCTPERLFEVGYKKLWQGSRVAGSFGINAHSSNIIAGIFLAIGQDIAHIVDASNTITTFELNTDSIYINVKISSLNIATIGGGTHLKPQADLLQLILTDMKSRCIVKNKTSMLAEIIAAGVLAGEISLNAAFASSTFSKAHDDLGRGNIDIKNEINSSN